MPSRIAGTGRYLPALVLEQRRPARARRRHRRRLGAVAHRHPRAPLRRRARVHVRPRARRGAQRARRREARAGRRRPDHRGDHDAGHDLPVDRVHPAGQARRARRAGVRRAGGVLRFRLRARDRRRDGVERRRAQCARRRRRDLLAHPRLERPPHLRAVRRRRRRGRAAAVARAGHPRDAPARRRQPARHAQRARPGARGPRDRAPLRPHGRPGGVQVRGQGAGRGRATRRSPPPASSARRSTG